MSDVVPEQATSVDAGRPFDPERIIAELDSAFEVLPEAAMRESREHRDVMVPRLIQAIQEATAKVRDGQKVDDANAHFFALFMLTEFGAKEALPAIIEAISLPDEGPFDLFEGAITSSLACILVRLSDDPLTLIDGLLRNRALNEYVRWEAAQAYVHLVRSGPLTREQAVEHLRQHLRRELDDPDESVVATGLLCTLDDLAPKEAYEDIKEAFERGLIDESMIDMRHIDGCIAEGEAGVRRHLKSLRVFDDAIKELRRWASFEPKPPEKPEAILRRPAVSAQADSDARAASMPEPVAQLTAAKRVGRNDPCPCGSGKKYKKCCLDKDRST